MLSALDIADVIEVAEVGVGVEVGIGGVTGEHAVNDEGALIEVDGRGPETSHAAVGEADFEENFWGGEDRRKLGRNDGVLAFVEHLKVFEVSHAASVDQDPAESIVEQALEVILGGDARFVVVEADEEVSELDVVVNEASVVEVFYSAKQFEAEVDGVGRREGQVASVGVVTEAHSAPCFTHVEEEQWIGEELLIEAD